MSLKIETHWQLRFVHEQPDGGTRYGTKKGVGVGGQRELAKARLNHPRDEITLYEREIVLTDWKKQRPDEPCSGSGYAHPAHGDCPGYSQDRT